MLIIFCFLHHALPPESSSTCHCPATERGIFATWSHHNEAWTATVAVASSCIYWRPNVFREIIVVGTRIAPNGVRETLSISLNTYKCIHLNASVVGSPGNGFIPTSSLAEILKELDDTLSPEDLENIIKEIDTDGSGTLDFDGMM